ncbi:MAG: M48 family metalloprotease [Gammaproteobacteria bacterium]|nr:M48 family metalloprotease [Gammaproteobacteria bacterium]MBU1968840.1 M48 family metalloprotease [Gammaproteobacteria bacterium]
MRHILIFLLTLTAFAMGGCATNPVSGGKDFVMMSESQEIALGRSADAEIRKQYKVYANPALQDYVNRVGQKLSQHSHRPNISYRFTVLDSPEINAFALPGGYVYITRGIMAYLNSEAEMAAVLGHEVGHVTARHGVRQQSAAQAANIGISIAAIFIPELNTQLGQDISNLFGGALLSGYGRDHELESDRLGAQYLARTDYDPQAMIRVVGVLKNQELFDAEIAKQEGREPRRYHGTFATHPDNDTRLQQVVGEAKGLTVANPAEGRDEFLKMTESLVFGDSIEEGIVRDNRFTHRDLGFALTFPPEWNVKNSPTQLYAISPAGDAAIQLKIDGKPSGTPAEYMRRALGSSASLEALKIESLNAAIGSDNKVLLGIIYHEGKAFIIQGNAKSGETLAAQRETMRSAIRSFHVLNADEKKAIKPLLIRVVSAKKGDTYEKLAQRSPLGKNAENYLRLMNAQYPKGELAAGQRVKIVE